MSPTSRTRMASAINAAASHHPRSAVVSAHAAGTTAATRIAEWIIPIDDWTLGRSSRRRATVSAPCTDSAPSRSASARVVDISEAAPERRAPARIRTTSDAARPRITVSSSQPLRGVAAREFPSPRRLRRSCGRTPTGAGARVPPSTTVRPRIRLPGPPPGCAHIRER